MWSHSAIHRWPSRQKRSELYRRLLRAGWEPGAAGNLAALVVGLRPAQTPWTLRQITNALFFREGVRRRLVPG